MSIAKQEILDFLRSMNQERDLKLTVFHEIQDVINAIKDQQDKRREDLALLEEKIEDLESILDAFEEGL